LCPELVLGVEEQD